MRKIALASLLFLTLNATVFAANTSDVSVQGNMIYPNYGKFDMVLNELYPGVNYKIDCLIEYNDLNGADIFVALFNSSSYMEVDGKKVNGNVLKLRNHYAEGHELSIYNINSQLQPNIEFVNLNNKATVNIRNCIAHVL